jgi:hypothetical protein
MKSFSVVLSVFAALSFLSCRTQTLAPDTGTATIKGQAILATDVSNNGLSGGAVPPFNGVQVSLEGTTFSAMTDDSGLYELDNVPEGTYNVRFSKAGYGEIRWFGKVVQGGGNAQNFWYDQQPWHNVVFPTLYKCSDFTTTLESATLKDTTLPFGYGPSHMLLAGHYSGIQPVSYYLMVVYFSHHSNLSSRPGAYDWFECWGPGGAVAFDTVQRRYEIPIDLGQYRAHGFKSGDSVYFATYGTPYWGSVPYYDYYDPNFHEYVLTSINQTPSPVIGLKIP